MPKKSKTPNSPSIPNRLKKTKIPKKVKIPQDVYRRISGLNYNKMNDNNKLKDNQKVLNYIAKNIGQILAPNGILTVDGVLFLLSIFKNFQLMDPPVQQTAVQRTSAAVEIDTFIDVRQAGNQTWIHSFASSSTVNRTRFQPPLSENTTQVAFYNQLFHEPMTNLAETAHEFSLSIHQLFHGINELLNCTTWESMTQLREWIFFGESIEQTHFKTICQGAILKAKMQNEQGMKQNGEIHHFSFQRMINMPTQRTNHFYAEDTPQNLVKIFQSAFENKYNGTTDSPTDVHNYLTETFWNGLTKTFSQFFREHEHMNDTQEQEGAWGRSLMGDFVDLFLRAFSLDYGKQIPTDSQQEKNLNIPENTQPTYNSLSNKTSQKKSQKNNYQEIASETTPETMSVLTSEEASYLTQLWYLAKDFCISIDNYLQKWVGLQFLGAEARPIPDKKIAKISRETIEKAKMHRIVTAYMNNQTLPITNEKPLFPTWDDADIFQKRNKTDFVNQAVKNFLCGKGIACGDLSNLETILAAQNWINNGGKDSVLRRNQLAYIILVASDLEKQEFSDIRGSNIFLQWRNNNALVGFTFIEDKMKTTTSATQIHMETTTLSSQDNVTQKSKNYSELGQVNENRTRISESSKKSPLPSIDEDFIRQWRKNLNQTNLEKYGKGLFNQTQMQSEISTTASSSNVTTIPMEATGLNVTQTGETDSTQEINEKIKAFLSENTDDPTKAVVKEEKESSLPKWNSEQKENIRKKLVDFFVEKEIDCDGSDDIKLLETVGEWVAIEGATPVTLDMVRVKQLAKLILEMEEEAIISEEEAHLILAEWVYETIKDNQPADLILPTKGTNPSQPTSADKQKNNIETEGTQWRDPNVQKKIESFLEQKKLLSGQSTKEQVLIAMGKRITKEENNKLVFAYERLQPVAKVILKELKLYGGKKGENISNKDAELTVMKWVFETILESSIEAYMVKKLVSAPDIDQFTLGRLRDLFTVRNLEKEGLIQLEGSTLSEEQKSYFNKLWNLFLQRELPNYFLDSSGLADNLLISDYHSLMQLTGAKILKEGEYQYPFSREDARLMGEHFWQTILEKGIATYEELRTLLIPSLIAIAQLDPDALREALATETYKEFAISTFIGYQKEGYYKLIENQELLNRLYKAYQEALLQWRRKDALAIKVAQTCIDSHGSSTPFNVIKQNYLEGSTNPCQDIDWFPPKIEARYTKLTKNVSDAYFHFDKKLIEFALNAVDKKDLEYIFSAGVQLYETFADLENEREELVEIPVTAGAPRINAILSVKEKKRTTLNLDKTDLFAAVKGNEQRIYALKQLDGEGGYTLHRVDQDPIVYLKLGLFDHKNIWKGGYQQVGNEILMGNKYFKFSVRVNRSKKLAHGAERNLLIEALGRKHSDKFYDQLYDSGNDKSDVEKLWDVAKHFIPFYDCATGIINQDTEEAVISCTIDTLLMIPVFGQITSLNMKFALGVARAFIRGGIRNVIKKSPTFLPKVAEIRKIVLTLARTIDPGFETIVGGGRLIIKRVVKFKNEFQIARKTKELLERIEVMEKARESLKKNIVMGQLNGLEVPVKGVGADLYMRVTNLETGDVFGGLFMFKGNRLEAHRPAVFTTEQLELLNNLEVKLKEKQAYFVGNNPNPNAYGSGPITTVAQEGEETKHFIRMKGKLIEVTLTTIKEHGIRLDVYARHSGKIIPVNYNGVEWYFEAPTSPFVPKEVEKKITSMLDQFETRKNPSGLSAPDEKGLMWDESGKSYIKVQDHYLSISLSKNKERYHLLKKDNSKSKIVLRFDEKNGKFRFETKLERKKENKSVLTASYHRGKSKGKSDLNKEQSRVSPGESPGTSGTSGNSKGTKNTSQEIGSKTNESGDVLASETFDRFKFGKQTGDVWNNIPPSKEKWDLWNKLRGAEVYKKPPSIRVEDSNVELPPLSKFVSEPTPIFHPNDNEARKSIVAQIKERLPIDFNFRTFAGVKANKMPDFLKPFVEDLEENLVQASDYLDAGITIFTKLSGKAILSETKEGQYLTKLFLLEGLANQEVILRETINRFLSISEKLKKFLRQSKLWEYENILIVSGDLIQQEVGSNKYLSQSTKLLPWGLVVPGDAECRIIIFADAFHINPQLIDPQLIQGCELTQSAYITLIHEITHLVSKTEDIITYPLPGKGLRISVKQQREIINNNFTAILYSEPFNAFVNQLAKELNLPTLSKDVVRQAMYNDRLLLVNFLLTDAEFTTIILRDLIEGRDFDEIIRVTRSTDNLNLEKKFMFLYFAMAFMYSYQGLERTLQLNKEKEKNSTKATDNLSTGIPSKEVPENTEIIVRTEFVEKIKDAEKKSFSDLVTTSIEKSNGTNIATGFVANRPIFAQPIQSRPKRSDLNLTTNTQEIRNNTQFVTNQQGVTEPTQHTANRSISNLINTSTEKSNNLRQTASIKSAERNNSSTLIK